MTLEVSMPRISPAEFSALPLRANTLLADVPLHDVWAVDLPRLREGVTLEEVLRRADRDVFTPRDAKMRGLPSASRALFHLRLLLGRLFRLEREPSDAGAVSFTRRLTVEDRSGASVVPGKRAGNFRVVYRFENEQLLEVHNRTDHAEEHSAQRPRKNGGRLSLLLRRVRRQRWLDHAALHGADRPFPAVDHLPRAPEERPRSLYHPSSDVKR